MTPPRNICRLPLQRAAALLAASVVALLVLSVSPGAWAFAPMCDPSGATVLAPLPAPPSNDGEILSLPCPEEWSVSERLHSGVPSDPAGLSERVPHDQSLILATRPFKHFPGRDSVGYPPSIELAPSSEHRRGQFKPPRAR